MAVVGIVMLIVVPFLWGSLILRIIRERNAGCLITFVTGFLSLFAFFFACLLVTLKFDISFGKFSMLYFGFTGLVSLAGIPFAINEIRKIRIDKINWKFLIPAVLLGAVSFFLFAPSYANDDTWEIVATSLTSDSIYEYSSMTGDLMKNGLPIFNKIYMMPMFFACFVKLFGVPMRIIGGFLFPILIYSICIGLVYKISEILNNKSKEFLVISYMIVMMAGTFLPSNGIPVSTGYAVLREGYSGYACFYGVVAPFFLYLILKKRYFFSVVSLLPLVGLVRLDRIFYALKQPIDLVRMLRVEDKLIGLFLICLFAAFVLVLKAKVTVKFEVCFLPGVFIAYILSELFSVITGKKERMLFVLVACFAASFCVNGKVFSDANLLYCELEYEAKVVQTLDKIEDGKKIWAPLDFTSVSRRVRGGVSTLYGRDDEELTMIGLDYESHTPYTSDYFDEIGNLSRGQVFYPFEHDETEVFENAILEGTDYIVIPINGEYVLFDAKQYAEKILTPELAPWRFK